MIEMVPSFVMRVGSFWNSSAGLRYQSNSCIELWSPSNLLPLEPDIVVLHSRFTRPHPGKPSLSIFDEEVEQDGQMTTDKRWGGE